MSEREFFKSHYNVLLPGRPSTARRASRGDQRRQQQSIGSWESNTDMARPRNEYDWKKIDPLLLMACMAFTEDDRDRLLGKITARYGMHRTTLSRRLHFIGGR